MKELFQLLILHSWSSFKWMCVDAEKPKFLLFHQINLPMCSSSKYKLFWHSPKRTVPGFPRLTSSVHFKYICVRIVVFWSGLIPRLQTCCHTDVLGTLHRLYETGRLSAKSNENSSATILDACSNFSTWRSRERAKDPQEVEGWRSASIGTHRGLQVWNQKWNLRCH